MSDIPGDLKYTKNHEWVRANDSGTLTIGITDHAQGQLGDLVFVELPEVGQQLAAGDSFAVVESVKAASDVYTSVAGTVTGINEKLADSPELVNQDPYGEGFLMTLEPEEGGDLGALLDAEAYRAVAEED
jgi:glycine cleavage system H protein